MKDPKIEKHSVNELVDRAAETFAQILIQQALCKKRSRQNKEVLAGNLPVFPSK